jgi:hypothetical protein
VEEISTDEVMNVDRERCPSLCAMASDPTIDPPTPAIMTIVAQTIHPRCLPLRQRFMVQRRPDPRGSRSDSVTKRWNEMYDCNETSPMDASSVPADRRYWLVVDKVPPL